MSYAPAPERERYQVRWLLCINRTLDFVRKKLEADGIMAWGIALSSVEGRDGEWDMHVRDGSGGGERGMQC